VRRFWTRYRDRWLTHRIPAQRSVCLGRNNIFIFPSRAGFCFLLLLLLLWLMAINYENNLLFALCFLLASLFIVSILHTYSNLAGLRITAISGSPAFAGEDAEFELLVARDSSRAYENLLLGWPGVPPRIVSLIDTEQQRVTLYRPTHTRGWLKPGRLLVQSYYPLGLLRTWTWLDLDLCSLVYPRPVAAGAIPYTHAGGEVGAELHAHGAEDFCGLRRYQQGESLRHIAWKHYARGQGLYTKEYAAPADRRIWLDWDYLAGIPDEERLSKLCYWVLKAAQQADEYGLRLPGVEVLPGRGEAHRDHLLTRLALFAV